MRRNIKALFNFDAPATTEEIDAAALQFVGEISGQTKPSKANQATLDLAVEIVSKCLINLRFKCAEITTFFTSLSEFLFDVLSLRTPYSLITH